ncbi:MAG: isochorismate synthase [Planctomycetales bacterium]|nr:isochorismate synthase [Planctomycetales bacterium]
MNPILEATNAQPSITDRDLRRRLTEQVRACREFPAVVQVPCSASPYRWLAAQDESFKLVWSERGGEPTTAGLGIALRITGNPGESAAAIIDRCHFVLRGLPTQRFFGGFSFRRTEPTDLRWCEFGAASFWLPRATLANDQLSIVIMDEHDVPTVIEYVAGLNLSDHVEADEATLPARVSRRDEPNRNDWTSGIESAMKLFADEVLEKIVLARRVDLQFSEPLSPVPLLEQLAAATPACFHFAFQLSATHGFIGATPERLYRRCGRDLESEVVAGTRSRGSSPDDDERLGSELLGSTKDQLEHDIVRKSIRQRLHGVVQQLNVDQRAKLLKLANKQHLYSHVRGTLAATSGDGELIERLHPTPAVGGYPTENALAEIARLERFDRGWYAAPVGWIGADSAEFAVAIRSGLVRDNELSLYSGAGIVPGSCAEDEWNEIEHKISDFLLLLP